MTTVNITREDDGSFTIRGLSAADLGGTLLAARAFSSLLQLEIIRMDMLGTSEYMDMPAVKRDVATVLTERYKQAFAMADALGMLLERTSVDQLTNGVIDAAEMLSLCMTIDSFRENCQVLHNTADDMVNDEFCALMAQRIADFAMGRARSKPQNPEPQENNE